MIFSRYTKVRIYFSDKERVSSFAYFSGRFFMKKLMAALFFFAIFMTYTFAGDAAVFQDIGFSKDGKVYIFGQYGKLDKSYEAWAEIYTVDIEKNVFIKSDVYKTKASLQTRNISGKEAFSKLLQTNEYRISKYKYSPASPSNLIYVNENENADPATEIVFKDFDSSTSEKEIFYKIKLCPTVTGRGKNVKSQFYIDFKKTDSLGNVILEKKVGNPDFKREGISSYRIARIFSDPSGKNIIFLVEKFQEDEAGTSIRYMVETLAL